MKVANREFRTQLESGVVPIHDPIAPAEIYKGSNITARLKSDDTTYECEVVRLSPLGIELLMDAHSLKQTQIGDSIEIELSIGGSVIPYQAIQVATIDNQLNGKIVGFRWCAQPLNPDHDRDRRSSVRWMCGEHYLPTGIAPNPARFNDFVYFVIKDISATGFQLSTSLRNKFLIPGMVLDATVSFPLIGEIRVNFQIINARITSTGTKDTLSLGVKLVSPTENTSSCIGQYILQFGPPSTVKELKTIGLKPISTDKAIEYSFVKTAEEYKKILELRHRAYSSVGKADSAANFDVMSDMFDTQSRILIASHLGKTVGSWRMTFHSPDEKNEYDRYATFPDSFFRRDETVVLSRICTDPEYRGSDLFYGMMRQSLIVSLQSKRRYILGGCSKELMPLYRKVGFQQTGIFFEHGGLKGVKEEVIVADSIGIITGRDVDVTVWDEIYSDLASYLEKDGMIEFDPTMNLRLATYRTFSPLARAVKNIGRLFGR